MDTLSGETKYRRTHKYEGQPLRGTKRRKDEEQIMIEQTPHMKPRGVGEGGGGGVKLPIYGIYTDVHV